MNIIRTTISIVTPVAFAALCFTPAANAEIYPSTGETQINHQIGASASNVGMPIKLAKKGRVEDAIRCLEENGVPKAIASAAAGACLVYPIPAKVIPCFVAFGIASGMADRCGGG
ncbi:hypothetical protein NONI108955_39015 [Nocardia ninae]|uniref:DUF732 domain-containing protein n=1 Tax=Nocardia ninae NBRC 108245 TaxID=1210091 RepID=A0A511MTR0_9NOCA|nr:hypothetical protein [Nocardia ninae]GEM43960.1 hypothetical protein NN4_84790 [Nocardia ninae NBRC 108245]